MHPCTNTTIAIDVVSVLQGSGAVARQSGKVALVCCCRQDKGGGRPGFYAHAYMPAYLYMLICMHTYKHTHNKTYLNTQKIFLHPFRKSNTTPFGNSHAAIAKSFSFYVCVCIYISFHKSLFDYSNVWAFVTFSPMCNNSVAIIATIESACGKC